jgi:hypothetical protein
MGAVVMDRDPDLKWDSSDFETELEQEDEWEYLVGELDEFIEKHNVDGDWYATVSGFGWQSTDGEKWFSTNEGRKFLQEVLPNTECTFKVWLDKETGVITIDNAHHDKPTGGEIYTIKPVSDSRCVICQHELDEQTTCQNCIKDLPEDKFTAALEKCLQGVGVLEILYGIPGIYDIIREEYNNEALDQAYQDLVIDHETQDKAAKAQAVV